MKGSLVPLVLATVLTVVACGSSTTSPSTTSPPATISTDTFTGTVAVKSSDSHNFTVAQTGVVNVTLTAAAPDSAIVMGLGVGTSSGSTCALLAGASTNTAAGPAVQLSGEVTPGTLCVAVYDVGNQTAPVTYTVTVAHP